MHSRKVFNKGCIRIGKDCDLIDMMVQTRRIKNFLKNYLTHPQKILMKFDEANVLNGSSSSGTDYESSDLDQKLVNNMNTTTPRAALVAFFSSIKIRDIL